MARTDDLRQNPEKYRIFLRGIYRAIDYIKNDHAKTVEIMAPHFKLSPADFETVLTNLAYTPYEEAVGSSVPAASTENCTTSSIRVMQLNLENGAADHQRFQSADRQFSGYRSLQWPQTMIGG